MKNARKKHITIYATVLGGFCPGAIVGFLTHPSVEAFVKCQDEIKKVMNEV